MKLESSAHQPKMVKRIQLRYALGLLAVAILLFAWFNFKQFIIGGDDLGHNDTTGWIAALRQTDSGEQAVAITPDDTVLESAGYKDGAIDQDVTWLPDGDRIYFVSNRDKSLQLYRWNPGRKKVDQRSNGKLAQEHPFFQEDGTPADQPTALVIKAGVVVDFNPKDGTAHQLVPVVGKSPTQAGGDEAGMGTQFGSQYEHLGTSFREAHWCKNRKYIAGIMRGDDGETLVVICLDPSATPSGLDDGQPHGIVKGEHIDMAIDPSSGKIAYSVNDFRFIDPEAMIKSKDTPPEMIKGGKLIKPFRNLLGILDPDDSKASGAIARWRVGDSPAGVPDIAFAEPQVSPDGKQIVFVLGADTPDGFKASRIMVGPFSPAGGAAAKPLVAGEGNIGSPCWSPDGKLIAFVVVNPDGHSDIDVIPSEGGAAKAVTTGKGSFSSPRFSPMMKPKSGS
jgi:hypothetical protein